jgi:hypothetical protein
MIEQINPFLFEQLITSMRISCFYVKITIVHSFISFISDAISFPGLQNIFMVNVVILIFST